MENEIGKRRMISVDGWRHDEDENCAPSGCIPVEARLAPQPAPGPQVDVREIAKKVAKVTVEAFKKLADWELAAEMELRKHLSAAPEVKGYDIRKNPEPAPGPQVALTNFLDAAIAECHKGKSVTFNAGQLQTLRDATRFFPAVPGGMVDVEALAHDIAMSVGTLIFNDKDWNVSKIEASVRKHLSAAQPGESGGAGWQTGKPTLSGEYIALFLSGTVSVAHWNASTNMWGHGKDLKGWNVTHWQPLPVPPSAGRKEQE